MPLETATYIDDLVTSNPADTDNESQGAAHLRLIKSCLKNSFPNLGDAVVTGTAAQLNELLTLLSSGGTIANQGLSTAIAPMGTIHTFARDPGTTLCARGGTATGNEQFILLDGSSYLSTKFPALSASSFITVSGSNFIVDNLCDTGRFIRAHVPGTTTPGSTEANQNAAHTHTITDPGHNHTQNPHNHAITDPGHTHAPSDNTAFLTNNPSGNNKATSSADAPSGNDSYTASNTTGITVNSQTATNNSNTTGITGTNSEGGTEARPESYIGFICLKT